MKICTNCNITYEEEVRYCRECGALLTNHNLLYAINAEMYIFAIIGSILIGLIVGFIWWQPFLQALLGTIPLLCAAIIIYNIKKLLSQDSEKSNIKYINQILISIVICLPITAVWFTVLLQTICGLTPIIFTIALLFSVKKFITKGYFYKNSAFHLFCILLFLILSFLSTGIWFQPFLQFLIGSIPLICLSIVAYSIIRISNRNDSKI